MGSSLKLTAESRQLDSLQSLYVMNAGNLSYAVNYSFQMLEVFDFDYNIYVCLTVRGTRFDVANVGFAVADDGGDLLQHAETVVTEHGQLHREGDGSAFFLAPFHINLALRLIHKIEHVGTVYRMHRHAFATSDITNDRFSPNRITAARAIDE